MELPKNITQIGQSDQKCKIYVEDYVISYIKQLNHLAENKMITAALYGQQKEENGITYLFFYGASRIESIQREVRHLSQAQNQEIEKLRRKYFTDYQFLGYRLLNGEMVEGFHICGQEICRYIKGYACFCEKNDSMLAYMLDSRKEETKPEEVEREKYDQVKLRQEERRAQHQESIKSRSSRQILAEKVKSRTVKEKPKNEAPKPASKNMRVMRLSVVAMFALLCVVGIAAMGGYGKLEELQVAARQVIAEFTEQKIPDATEETTETGQSGNADTLITEDKLADAILQENENVQAKTPETPETAAAETEAVQESTQTASEEAAAESTSAQETQESTAQEASEPVVQQTTSVSYTIQKGDTLIGISLRTYGTESRVQEICDLNNITDPDNIQIGQNILLP